MLLYIRTVQVLVFTGEHCLVLVLLFVTLYLRPASVLLFLKVKLHLRQKLLCHLFQIQRLGFIDNF